MKRTLFSALMLAALATGCIQVKLNGGNAELWLTVAPWGPVQENPNEDLGAVFPIRLKIAQWNDVSYGDGTSNGPGYFE